MAMSSLTTAKRHELFAASAAYAAVVVFIGNFGVQQVEFLNQPKWVAVLASKLMGWGSFHESPGRRAHRNTDAEA